MRSFVLSLVLLVALPFACRMDASGLGTARVSGSGGQVSASGGAKDAEVADTGVFVSGDGGSLADAAGVADLSERDGGVYGSEGVDDPFCRVEIGRLVRRLVGGDLQGETVAISVQVESQGGDGRSCALFDGEDESRVVGTTEI